MNHKAEEIPLHDLVVMILFRYKIEILPSKDIYLECKVIGNCILIYSDDSNEGIKPHNE